MGMLFFICKFLSSIINVNDTLQQNNVTVQEAEVLYYKDVDVKVKDIKQTWSSNKQQTWSLTVTSEEYGLEKSFSISSSSMYSDVYANDIYRGNLKVGNTIKCEMFSWCIGDTVTRRELNKLVSK